MQTYSSVEGIGESITRAASRQTYYTVRFLVDPPLVADAYRAYAYFRWVDDWLDEPVRQAPERHEFLRHQASIVDACFHNQALPTVSPEEDMIVGLIRKDPSDKSGLGAYIRNMMAVMSFDAERRGRLISSEELARYAHSLAMAVTEALHYFIGHNSASPHDSTRYLAAEGAHIAHMLRDAIDDSKMGYFNIPAEYLHARRISAFDFESAPYRAWVRSRVQLARSNFQAGRAYLSQVESLRCRLAGYAYIARFETVLDSIERDGYLLRPEYREAKSPLAGAEMGLSILWSALNDHRAVAGSGALIGR